MIGKYIYFIAAAIILASCSNDPEPAGVEQLPDGKYPLMITASIDGIASRAAGDKTSWKDDYIGVRIGDAPEIGKYQIRSNGNYYGYNSSVLYWRTSAVAEVTAWYPYNPTEVNLADQSKADFNGVDFMQAKVMATYRNNPLKLPFKHRLAKVKYELINEAGIPEKEWMNVRVEIFGYTKVNSDAEGNLSGSDENWIKPGNEETWIMPQDMTGRELIRVFATVDGQPKTFTYIPDTNANGEILSNKIHTYRITVKRDGAWISTGVENISSDVYYPVSDIKLGDYIYEDGTASDGGLRGSDGGLKYDNVAPLRGKKCVGVVFHIRNDESYTDVCDYNSFAGEPTGYIVSLDEKKSRWSDGIPVGNDQTPKDVINGYKYTEEYGQKYSDRELIAIPWCTTRHTPIPSADDIAFSTWYLPSFLEYKTMRCAPGGDVSLDFIERNIRAAGGTGFSDEYYFTCQLMGNYGNYLHMYNLESGGEVTNKNYIADDSPYRAVCAFKLK